MEETMKRIVLTACGLFAVLACGKGDQKATATADSLSRDLQLAPVDSTAKLNDKPATPAPAAETPAPQPAAPAPTPAAVAPKPKPKPAAPKPTSYTLNTGTEIKATSNDSLSSRHEMAGQTFTASVGGDIADAKGHVVIPAGSTIKFTIVTLEPAKNKSQADGKIELTASEVTINGKSYPISATVSSVEHTLKGRGVTAGEAEKVGVGAAAGAIAGRIIGGNKKGTIIGGVVGAAAGTAVAIQTASRDVVVAPGAAIVMTLDAPLTVER
jgi:hypothetical protein